MQTSKRELNMLPRAILLLSAIINLLLAACSVKTTGSLSSESFRREISGNYSGVLPCASCPGIQTSITLKENRKYNLSRTYLDRDTAAFTGKGTIFETNKDSVLVLKNEANDEKTYIKLEDSKIRILNQHGKKIAGKLSKLYLLNKRTQSPTIQDVSRITGKKWELKSMNGFSEEQLKRYPRIPTMEFDAEDQRVSGFAGCNTYFGNYQVNDQGKISFSRLASTKKACINSMELENAFLHSLEKGKWISVKGKTLNLKDEEGKVLASFVTR